jgi:hypothetical protein
MEHIDDGVDNNSLKFNTSYARAILVDRDNVLVECHLDGSFLLPGSICVSSTKEHILTFLKYKLGVEYNFNELKKKFLIKHFCDELDDSFDDFLVSKILCTDFFEGKYKGIDYNAARATDYSLLKLIDIDELIELTSHESKNKIVCCNNIETNTALKVYKKLR